MPSFYDVSLLNIDSGVVNMNRKFCLYLLQNIKKLLKIPFSKSQVSMAVHRIGKTLLLDELDLYQHLRTASKVGNTYIDWSFQLLA